jgi:hypothetical protein
MHEQDFNLSNEFQALMPAIQRPRVTAIAATRHKAGLNGYTNGRVTAEPQRVEDGGI